MTVKHDMVVGLGFGDEGKGTLVDYLCTARETKAVIRFSGGSQTAHNVVTPDGRWHTFAQFGSGTLQGVPTFLSKYVLFNPIALMNENHALSAKVSFDPLSRLFVDKAALVVTPYHVWVNQKIVNKDGSCGQGIGETMRMKLKGYSITVGDLLSPNLLTKLTIIRDAYCRQYGDFQMFKEMPHPVREIASMYRHIGEMINQVDSSYLDELLASGRCVFEGSQGVLLDEWHGFHPHTTWSTTTPSNALALLNGRDVRVIGAMRSYMTRHGRGPFPTESPDYDTLWPEVHNKTGRLQGAWRRGELDLPLLRYAIEVSEQIDELAITHMDRALRPVVIDYDAAQALVSKQRAGVTLEDLSYQAKMCQALEKTDRLTMTFDGDGASETEFLELIQQQLARPVTVVSRGATSDDKTELVGSYS